MYLSISCVKKSSIYQFQIIFLIIMLKKQYNINESELTQEPYRCRVRVLHF